MEAVDCDGRSWTSDELAQFAIELDEPEQDTWDLYNNRNKLLRAVRVLKTQAVSTSVILEDQS